MIDVIATEPRISVEWDGVGMNSSLALLHQRRQRPRGSLRPQPDLNVFLVAGVGLRSLPSEAPGFAIFSRQRSCLRSASRAFGTGSPSARSSVTTGRSGCAR